MINNLMKLGLYFSLIGEGRLDPMVFEIIREERRMRAAEEASKHETLNEQHDDHTDDIRKAA